MKNFCLLFFLLLQSVVFAQHDNSKSIFLSQDSLPNIFNEKWLFNEGDDSSWAYPSFNDDGWKIQNPNLALGDSLMKLFKGICWFRLHIVADTSVTGVPLAIELSQSGASQVFLNGRLIKSFGNIRGSKSDYFDPNETPFIMIIPRTGENLLAVRYANYDARKNQDIYWRGAAGFSMKAGTMKLIEQEELRKIVFTCIFIFLSGLFTALAVLHFLLFLYSRVILSNLFFSIFISCLAFLFIISFMSIANHSPSLKLESGYVAFIIICLTALSLSAFINELFHNKKGRRNIRFKIITGIGIAAIILRMFNNINSIIAGGVLITFVLLEAVIIVIIAILRKVKGAGIIGTGILFFAIFILSIISTILITGSFDIDDSTPFGQVIFVITVLAIISIPVSMSAYLAWNFSTVNKNLAHQLEQVKILSQQTLDNEFEKKRLLESRKQELEDEVMQRTSEVTKQKEEIENQHKLLKAEKENVEKKSGELSATLDELKLAQAGLIQSEKMASLGQVTAGIAHEIKNPLNFVNNFSELSNELVQELQEAKTDEERKEILNDLKKNLIKVLEHGKRADRIVQSMLQHSRGGSGEKQLTDINKLCNEFMDLAYHGMRANVTNFNCAIVKDFDPGVPLLNMVSQDFSRVILNLLNNAFYAVMKRSETTSASKESYQPAVTLITKSLHHPEKVTLIVRDNGNGIPREIIEKIFDPFFTTKPTGEGTGLGLSISYDIIKAHGAELTVNSVKHEFTEFVIELSL